MELKTACTDPYGLLGDNCIDLLDGLGTFRSSTFRAFRAGYKSMIPLTRTRNKYICSCRFHADAFGEGCTNKNHMKPTHRTRSAFHHLGAHVSCEGSLCTNRMKSSRRIYTYRSSAISFFGYVYRILDPTEIQIESRQLHGPRKTSLRA